MGIAISTAGVTVGYAIETEKGKRPTTGFTLIPDIKEVPELNPEPAALDASVLSGTEYKTYIEGLKDLGGALSFLANLTTELITVWSKLVTDAQTAAENGLATWFEIKHPKIDESVWLTGQPSAMGLPGMSVDSVVEINLYITPTNAPTWQSKSNATA